AYSLVWGGIDRERYLLAVTPLLLPFCVLEADRWRRDAARAWVRAAGALAFAGTLVSLGLYVVRADVQIARRTGYGERFSAGPNPAWSNPYLEPLAAWIEAHTAPTDVLAAENPFLLNYLTRRPAVVLPERIEPARFAEFLRDYGVRYWVSNAEHTKRA